MSKAALERAKQMASEHDTSIRRATAERGERIAKLCRMGVRMQEAVIDVLKQFHEVPVGLKHFNNHDGKVRFYTCVTKYSDASTDSRVFVSVHIGDTFGRSYTSSIIKANIYASASLDYTEEMSVEIFLSEAGAKQTHKLWWKLKLNAETGLPPEHTEELTRTLATWMRDL